MRRQRRTRHKRLPFRSDDQQKDRVRSKQKVESLAAHGILFAYTTPNYRKISQDKSSYRGHRINSSDTTSPAIDNHKKTLENSLERRGLRIIDITFVIARRDIEHVKAICENICGWINKGNPIRASRFVDALNFVRLVRVAIYFGHPVEARSPRGCPEKFTIKHLHRSSPAMQPGGEVECIVTLSLTAAAGVRKQAGTSDSLPMRAQAGRQPAISTEPNRSNLHARLSMNPFLSRVGRQLGSELRQRHSQERPR